MNSSYLFFVADVFTYDGATSVGFEEFDFFDRHFGGGNEVLFAKIDNTYLPVRPSSSIPSNAIAVSDEDAEEFDIEEERGKAVWMTDPRTVRCTGL